MFAQTYFITRGLPLSEIAGSGSVITDLSSYSSKLPIGFSFNYYGNTYTDFYIGRNGIITFGSGSSINVNSLPSSSTPNNVIAFASTYRLDCITGSPNINYFTTGTAPNRVLVVNFKNVQHTDNPAHLTSVQVQLFEGSTGKIEIHSILNESGVSSNGYPLYRTIGIENATGSVGISGIDLNYTTGLVANNEMIRFETVTECNNTITATTSTSTICEGLTTATLTVTSSPTGTFTYQWFRNNVAIVGATNSTYTATLIGTYYARATGSGGCIKQSSSIVISRTYNPTINASTPYACNVISVNTSPSGGYTYQWYKDNVLISGQTASSTTPTTTGGYSVKVTSGGCNVTTSNVIIKTNTAEIQNIIPNNCSNMNLATNLSSYPSTRSYSWSGPNNFTSTQQNPTINNVTAANQGIYSVTVNFGCGTETKTATTSIIISANVLKPSANSANVCGTITLKSNVKQTDVNPSTTYSWSGPNNFTSSSNYVSINNAAPANAGTYSVTVNYGCGDIKTATTNVLVTQNSITIAGRNQNNSSSVYICNNLNLFISNYTGNYPTGYSWTGPNNFSSSVVSPTINNVGQQQQGIYTLTATYSCGPPVTATVNVIILPLNNIIPIVNDGSLSASVYVCNPINFQTTILPSNSSPIYSWNGPNNFSSTSATPTIPTAVTANGGTYTVTATLTGCGNFITTGTVNLTVNERTLSINNISSYGGVCTSSSFTLSATYSQNGTPTYETSTPTVYSWSGPNGFSSREISPTLTNVTENHAGIYTVSVNIGNGCRTLTTSTPTLRIGAPTISATNSTNEKNTCVATNVNLYSSSSWSGASLSPNYTWTGPNGYSSNVMNPSFVANANSSGVYTVEANFGSCGTSSASTYINITTPTIKAVTSQDLFCVGSGTSLSATINGTSSYEIPSPTITTYSWVGPNGFSSTTRNPVVNNLMMQSGGFYTLTVVLSGGCTGTYTSETAINVTQNPGLVASNGSVNDTPFECANNPRRLYASSAASLWNTTVSYIWSGPDGFSSTLAAPTINPDNAGGVYTVTATYSGGCVGTYSAMTPVFVKKRPSFKLSNSVLSIPVTGCVGGTINLPSVSGVSSIKNLNYSWTGPNGFIGTQNGSVLSTSATAAMAGVYTLTVNDSLNRCPLPYVATTNVIINNCPSEACILRAGTLGYGTESVCAGSTVALYSSMTGTSNNVVAYSWTGPNGFSSNQQRPILYNVNSPATYTVTASVTNGQCVGIYTQTVSIGIITPNNSPSLNFGINSIPCEGSRMILYNIVSGGVLVSYSINGPNGLTLYGDPYGIYYENPSYRTSSSFILQNVSSNMAGNYTVVANLQGNCTNTIIQRTQSINVVVNPVPDPPIISANPTSLNLGETTTLTGNSSSMQWSTSAYSTPTLVDAPLATATYWAVSRPTNDCISGSSNRVTVTLLNNCTQTLTLLNPTNNYATGTVLKQASSTNGNITATNLITGNAKVTYQAKSIILNAGFKADKGTVFLSEIGGCN
jgi:trimeric autotransporter adhesin